MALIPGQLSLSKWKSDGDTFAFKADDLQAWAGLPVKPRPTEAAPWVRVRLDGCDAPELHALTGAQSSLWGRLATEWVWSELGGLPVVWSLAGNVPLNTDTVNVRVAVTGIDIFKRAIIALWRETGDTESTDTLNVQMVGEGLAYAAVYNTTPSALASGCEAAWASAVSNLYGFAPLDISDEFDLLDVSSDQALRLIHPKLWRRVDYFTANHGDVAEWEAFQKTWSQLYQPPGQPIYNLRKTMIRSGSVLSVDPSIIGSVIFAKGQAVTSQIQKLLGALLTLP